MNILAVDTATRCQSVALMDETTVVAHDSRDDCVSHSGSLLPAIHALLQSAGSSLSVVDGLAVSAGPGSFTGLRVGLATMIGLRLVTGLPLVTVSTLEAMAWRQHGGLVSLPLCPMLTARANDVYWAQFHWREGRMIRLTDDRMGTVRDVVEAVHEPTVMFGEGWLRHRDAFTEALGDRVVHGAPGGGYPSAVAVGLLSLSSFRTRTVAGPLVAPHYMQPSEAEVQWNINRRPASS